MTAPFEPVTIVEEWCYAVLSANVTVTAEVGDRIYPAFSPATITTRHLVHDFAGPDEGIAAVPMGQGIALLSMLWDVTAWEPREDRQLLRPVMKAVQAELAGSSIRGLSHRFGSADGSVWALDVTYRGPIVVPADVGPPGVWQRVSARFEVRLRPVS